ncbi:MAG: hypothetical protein PR2021_5380 [Candidatus Phytoplasma pruni]|uniref:hypothetical protein n=1 Tax=Poinsettia branch-inducing phytoplasma TaxID=138647 RepID=UPI0003678B69|nr:hypothetical protein [Poinsettia branch-inducing phytoplasma]WEK82603.1 MAG: hypothetical protein PR2021_5380 [Candidatus Phytoplasma pruni]
MSIQGKKVWKYFVIFLTFSLISPIYGITPYRNKQPETKKTVSPILYPSIEKIKTMLPIIKDAAFCQRLLEHVVKMIFAEIDKEYYNFQEKDKENIDFLYQTLEKYNIVEEFSNTIATTVFDPNEYLFVFVGNANDLQNYQIYLQHKKNNFQGDKGSFWRNWQPANMIFVSKKHIQFLIDKLLQAMLLEEEMKIINSNPLFQNSESYKNNLQPQIQFIQQEMNSLKEELGRERCLNISINNEMLDLQ